MIDPAHSILTKFGGPVPVSLILKIDVTRVRRWAYPKDRGGCDGVIPARHWRALIDEGKRRGIKLKADDFLPAADARAA